MIDHYVLVGRTPILVDLLTWAQAFEKRFEGETDYWSVARTEINERCHVSTVFLGVDHSFGGPVPLLFESMVFGGPLDSEQRRYHTYSQAEIGHAGLVIEARLAIARVDAILKAAT
jgi:hypothetical protein